MARKRTIRQRIREHFQSMPESSAWRFYGPAQVRLNGRMDDIQVQSLSNELHRMAREGILEQRLLRGSDYPPARRYGYRARR